MVTQRRPQSRPNDPLYPSTAKDAVSWIVPPNRVDDVYLELPRSILLARGVVVWLGALAMAGAAVCAWLTVISLLDGEFTIAVAGLAATFVGLALGVYMIRLDLEPPKDEPIRFNRLRRKVYVYRFYTRWNPFSREGWGVRPVAYDWDDLRVELVSNYAPTVAYASSYQMYVVKPGTEEEIDRFTFCVGENGAYYWEWARNFMQQGPQALPKFDGPPRDWNNEDPGINIARWFAPKVQWPHDMDIESRTAP